MSDPDLISKLEIVRNLIPDEFMPAITQAIDALSTGHEPPAECDGCEQYAVMHAEIALALDIHDEADAHHLQELILRKLRAAQPPATAQMTLARANEIAEDIAEAMRITSKGEWVIDLIGGPFTADQLEAIAVIMRDEASETKGEG